MGDWLQTLEDIKIRGYLRKCYGVLPPSTIKKKKNNANKNMHLKKKDQG
jgi:hypothetical protein